MRSQSGKTKAQAATEAARKQLKEAKTKLAKQENETNKINVATAKTKVSEALFVENRERFVNLGGLRFGKVITALDVLSNVANRKTYSFDKDDVEEGFAAILNKLNSVRSMFEMALAPTAAKATEEGKPIFSFSKK